MKKKSEIRLTKHHLGSEYSKTKVKLTRLRTERGGSQAPRLWMNTKAEIDEKNVDTMKI